ncbi:hypothetical protein K9L05_01475 [Candidatus Babeliales bacterium]|nr:hypothetical protein [Candidatus Babeliales bacterium]
MNKFKVYLLFIFVFLFHSNIILAMQDSEEIELADSFEKIDLNVDPEPMEHLRERIRALEKEKKKLLLKLRRRSRTELSLIEAKKQIKNLEDDVALLRHGLAQADKQNMEYVFLRRNLFNQMMPVVESAELDAEHCRADAVYWKNRANDYEKILIAIFNAHPEIKEQIVAGASDSDA